MLLQGQDVRGGIQWDGGHLVTAQDRANGAVRNFGALGSVVAKKGHINMHVCIYIYIPAVQLLWQGFLGLAGIASFVGQCLGCLEEVAVKHSGHIFLCRMLRGRLHVHLHCTQHHCLQTLYGIEAMI